MGLRNGKIVYSPHRCAPDYYPNMISGMVWKCNECGTHWMWDREWRRLNRLAKWLYKW